MAVAARPFDKAPPPPVVIFGGEAAVETVSDARWFPLRYDLRSDQIYFAFVSGKSHGTVAFLKNVEAAMPEMRAIPRSVVNGIRADEARLHLILHSGLGGSTLLSRALSQPGVVTTLKEPPILTDVIAYALRNAAGASAQLLEDVTRLLSRPLSPGEAIVCKMNSIGNGLVSRIAEQNHQSQILCLRPPLDEMLASYASRGIEGRLAARKLFNGMRNARMIPFELSDRELLATSDLQLAALAWLAVQNMIGAASAGFGADRVRTISTQQLLEQPGIALGAVARHFRLDIDVEARLASGIFERHAKSGEPFSAAKRAQRMSERLRAHRLEIEPVVSWSRKVAEAAGISLDLPYPLLD